MGCALAKSKGCGVCLGTLVPTTGRCPSKECVSKGRVWELPIAKHPVIGQELLCKHGVQASAYAPLCGQLNSLLCAFWGNHPAARVIKSIGAVLRLAGNVGNMSTTCWQHVEMSMNLGIFACGCQHQNSPDTKFLCQKLPTLYGTLPHTTYQKCRTLHFGV
jgi:hypothetical protein